MTTERKMLEYAAKACGCELDWYPSTRCDLVTKRSVGEVVKLDWNPLTNSADCAAMCAKLEISTNWYSVDGIRESILWSVSCSLGPFQVYEAKIKDHNNDRESAWRYAATMVAAKIGGMK